jgi:signal recognition particle subunit SRP19
LKEYKRQVLWLDYFNSSISRSEGRRIPLDRSVKDPRLDELVEAVQNLGYSPEPAVLKHPKRMSIQSGCVSVEKRAGVKKSSVIFEVAGSLSTVRGKRAQAASQSKVQPQKGSHQGQQRQR